MARHTGTHALTLEALKTFGVNGATRPELLDLIYDDLQGTHDSKVTALSNALFREKQKGNVVLTDGRYWAKEFAPTAKTAKPTPHANGKVEVTQYATGRKPKTVTIYTTPEQYENVIGIVLYIKGQETRMPVFGSVRLCIGPDAPKWSPEQEMYLGVDKVVLHHKGGGRTEKIVLPHDRVVIAPEE